MRTRPARKLMEANSYTKWLSENEKDLENYKTWRKSGKKLKIFKNLWDAQKLEGRLIAGCTKIRMQTFKGRENLRG